ncbi:ABC transporter B family member 4 [Apostasia shenzhenica]|uniref:ABC transporter B family member 4 n=1 Tax=Apostasia shenzhenica TaxID=1088818 RepID=A0A2I0B3D3_9ASPA|nr:ABC transporter B family member 4 [Apostasia shenzhenica]
MQNPNGEYCRLIRMQEMNQNSNQMSQSDNDKITALVDERRSSQHISLKSSISRDSLVEPGLAAGIDVKESISKESTMNILEQTKEMPPIRRLACLNKPEIPILLLGSIFAIINGLFFPIVGVLLSSIINTFYEPPPKLEKDSKFWALVFLIFGAISFIAYPARTYLFGVAGSRLIKRVQLMTFEKVVNMEIAWFDAPKNSSGAIVARLSTDAATVRSLVGDALALIIQNITTLIAGLVFAFIADWQLSLIILATIPHGP